MRLSPKRAHQLQVSFRVGIVLAAIGLVFLARFKPSWPWFSLWLFGLMGGLLVLQMPPVRRALNLSWFAITLLTLTGVCLFNLFLFHVETHRQRSERLEIQGVYFDPNQEQIRVGVGWSDLDARLEGSLYDFDRWSVALRRLDGSGYAIEDVRQVDMLRTRDDGWRRHLGSPTRPVFGVRLDGGQRRVAAAVSDTDTMQFELERAGPRGTLIWDGATAPLSLDEPVLDRRLSRRLRMGVALAELDWDSVPDRDMAEDLVITRVTPGRSLGRIRISLPRYRIVSRSDAEAWQGGDRPRLASGDTLWVTSRGKTWAFAVDRVPGVSRVAAPVAINFVRRPRPTGWPLPSSEACGRAADRCAVLSTRPLPPPQAHFDVSGFGLDTARYSLLARLEASDQGARLVGARKSIDLPYGETKPVPAMVSDGDLGAGFLVRAHRSAQGRQRDVWVTVLGLYLMILGALFTVSGDARLWQLRRASSPHVAAAWALFNVFLVFMGVRLVLGLRVAYTPPFLDRAASTAVGLWVTVAVLMVALGRWTSWTPRFWKLVRRFERPVSKIFLPGMRTGAEARPTSTKFTLVEEASPEDRTSRRKAMRRTAVGLILLFGTLVGLLAQRPGAAPSLLVALIALGAWVAMGLARPRDAHWPLSSYPLRVITADAEVERPSLAFGIAAGASVVLALAMHAPVLALVPVLVLLLLFVVDQAASRGTWARGPRRRGWVLVGTMAMLTATGTFAFVARPAPAVVTVLALFAAGALWLGLPRDGSPEASRLAVAHRWFVDLRSAVFGGVGWLGVLALLGSLVFLNTQEIPPFVRFALVFALFLLAIRAGLACNRVLRTSTGSGYIEGLVLLVIPLGVLLVFMLFDFGLGLVFFLPMFITVLLSARVDRLPAPLLLGSAGVVAGLALVAVSVLRPSLDALRESPDVASFAEEYRNVGNGLVDAMRAAGLGGPVTRATVRSMAASDPALLEQALAFAGPSDALFAAAPSLEQVWGGRAYAASGWTGTGFAGTTSLGRGVPTAVSYAENSFSVYVMSEHGALGGIAVLLLYLALLVVVAAWIWRVHETVQDSPLGLSVVALTVGGVLWLVLPAVYVAASNIGAVPLTGQNMPFLGLNSWADVVLVGGLSTGMTFGLTALDAGDAREEVVGT